jgi:16S rRNA (guanine527-N7)-methyltransferase
LPDIVELTAHLLNDNGALLAMKGHTPEDELHELDLAATIIPLHVPMIEAERCLVRLKK